jgi:hypothetical protein
MALARMPFGFWQRKRLTLTNDSLNIMTGGNMAKVIYINNGCQVEVTGSLIVRLPDGRIADRYNVNEVEVAIETADEIARMLPMVA